jgi:hypothetical protein
MEQKDLTKNMVFHSRSKESCEEVIAKYKGTELEKTNGSIRDWVIASEQQLAKLAKE